MNSLYAVFRKYCREHGEELILGAFDQFVFIYFIILLINCEKQHVSSVVSPEQSLNCSYISHHSVYIYLTP